MHVVIHHSSFFDWVPVPPGVDVATKDISLGRVKKALDGKWLMRVERPQESFTTILIPEKEIWQRILQFELRSGLRFGRLKSVADYLQERVLPHHTKMRHVTKIEVNDDGPLPDEFRQFLAALVNDDGHQVFDEEHINEMIAEYVADKETDMAAYLSNSYGVNK